jgi:hypothetical protein
MKKALALPLFAVEPALVLWGILCGELIASLVLLADGQIPTVAVRALQLFLRF